MESFELIGGGEALAVVVERHLGACVTGFLERNGLRAADITDWVCHPGGPEVIDAVRDALGLD